MTADKNDEEAREIRRQNWSVMRPFVKFTIGAIGIIARALFSIVKGVIKLRPDKPGISKHEIKR